MNFSSRAYILVPRKEIAYFKFLIEAWDNLAYLTVIDKYKAVVELTFYRDFIKDILKIIEIIKEEIPIKILYLKKE